MKAIALALKNAFGVDVAADLDWEEDGVPLKAGWCVPAPTLAPLLPAPHSVWFLRSMNYALAMRVLFHALCLTATLFAHAHTRRFNKREEDGSQPRRWVVLSGKGTKMASFRSVANGVGQELQAVLSIKYNTTVSVGDTKLLIVGHSVGRCSHFRRVLSLYARPLPCWAFLRLSLSTSCFSIALSLAAPVHAIHPTPSPAVSPSLSPALPLRMPVTHHPHALQTTDKVSWELYAPDAGVALEWARELRRCRNVVLEASGEYAKFLQRLEEEERELAQQEMR